MGISTGYGRTVTSGSVFAFDTADVINSYKGEPTTNHIYHQNARIDSTYESYMPESGTGQVAANHPGAIRVYNINGSDISYYLNTGINISNSGVEWYNTRHAYWIYDTILKRPVVRMYNETGVWQAKYLGLGIASLNSIGATAGTSYTVSWLQYVESLDRAAHVGVYSYSTTLGYNDFHDGLQNGYNTQVNTWQRVSVTFTATNNGQLNSGPSMYFYGHNIGGGELRIADVQLEVKTHATQYSSVYTRSTTDALKPLAGNSSIDLTNVSFDANAQLTFDGTDDYIDITTNFGTLSEYTIEHVSYKGSNNRMPISSRGGPLFYQYGDNSWYYTHGGVAAEYYYPTTKIINGWGHWVITYNGSYVKIYRNGIFEGQQATSGTADWTNGFKIGNYIYGSYPWNGQIAVVKMYNRALTDGEVTQNYNKYKTKFKLS
jgi:hypothetical protein